MELSRRQALAAAGAYGLSLTFGAAACSTGRKRTPGSIAGPATARGHLLKEGAPLAPGAAEAAEIVIIGGGVAGLSAAWKLSNCNFNDFMLLDLEDAAGGTAISGTNETCSYPWGAHYVPVPTRDQRALCELLLEMRVVRGFDSSGRAVAAEEHICRAPEERLFYRGEWSEGLYLKPGASADDIKQFDRFESEMRALAGKRGRDGKRAFAIPMFHSSSDPEFRDLDRISMADWLAARNYNSPRLLWYVEYACRDDFGSYLRDVSAWAALHYYCSRLPDESSAPAAFLTWPEGNGRIVHYLSKNIKNRSRFGALALSVEPRPDAVRVVYHDFTSQTQREIIAKHVICATPQFITKRLVAGATDRNSFHYAPWLVANITLHSQPESRGFATAWDNVLYESDSLGYVVAKHQLDRRGPGDVWTWYRPFCDADAAAARTKLINYNFDELTDILSADLVRAHPDLADRLANVDFYKWGHGMVRPERGFLFGGARERAAAPIGNIHFAAADLGGLPLFEEAQWAGVRAAEEILAARGVSFTSSL
ncbi:MAG: NAD(P)-binding protein [Planctomycetes bacterium]|nr:NAD(P)-binding protein [Planctomycetota bacterium]